MHVQIRASLIHRPVFGILFFGVVCTTACQRSTRSTDLRLSGTLEMTEIYLSPVVAGDVATVTVQEGDRVKKGQQIATLRRFDQARRDYERLRRVLPVGGSTEERIEHAKLDWDDQQLLSPIDGLVLLRVSEPGEAVTPGMPVVVIGNPQDIWMRVYVPEGDIGRVHVGQRAAIQVDAFAGRTFPGRVTFVSPQAEFTPKNIQTKEERVTQMFAVKITVDQTGDAATARDLQNVLKPGMPVDADLNLGS